MVALALAVFTGLAVEVALGRGIVGIDVAVRNLTTAHYGSRLVRAAALVPDLLRPELDVLVFGGIAAALALRRRSWRPVLFAASVVAMLAVGVLAVKYGLNRPTPFPYGDALAPSGRGAFPSGHTASFLVCGGGSVLLLTPPRRRSMAWWALAGVTTVLAAALVLANFHWLSDVLGGAALGIAVLGAAPQRWAALDPANAVAPVATTALVPAEPAKSVPGITLALPASLAVWFTVLGLMLALARPQRVQDWLSRAVAEVAPSHTDAVTGAPLVTLLWLAGAACAALALLALARGQRAR